MSNLLTREYEISIWDDEWNEQEGEWVERRLAVIGKNNSNAQEFAKDAKFVQKVKGSNDLTFKMYYSYYDTITGKKVSNPFTDLIKNETKIKLKYDGKWYDFIVKDINKNSKDKTFTYTLTDLHINELSKNGYEITLDTELMNNIDTAQNLTESILKGTDWTLDEENSDLLPATTDEPLIEFIINQELTNCFYIDDTDETKIVECPLGEGKSIPENSTIYVFYSCCQGKPHRFQFIYFGEQEKKWDKENIISNTNVQYYIDAQQFTYVLRDNGQELPDFIASPNSSVENTIRGRRYVFTHKQVYDEVLGRYVYSYKGKTDEKEYYGYTETEYLAPNLLKNCASNNSFKVTDGWKGQYIYHGGADKDDYKNKHTTYAAKCSTRGTQLAEEWSTNGYSNIDDTEKPYICLTFPKVGEGAGDYITPTVTNSGFYDNRIRIGNLQAGQKFVVYYRPKTEAGKDFKDFCVSLADDSEFGCQFNAENHRYEGNLENSPLKFECSKGNIHVVIDKNNEDTGYRYVIATVGNWQETERTFANSKYQLFFTLNSGDFGNLEFYDLQIFPYVDCADGGPLLPDSDPTSAKIITHYYFYDPVHHTNQSATKAEDYKYLTANPEDFIPNYVENAQQSRAITVSKSNRFNALQTIAETFQCWIKPEVEHGKDGSILSKKVAIKRYIANKNYCGIRYGVNLNDISRKCETKNITTKLIVQDNNNEFAQNGFCSISRAHSNQTGEKHILDFSYYVNTGLINTEDLLNDFWSNYEVKGLDETGGYYVQLRKLNDEIDEATEKSSRYYLPLVQAEADVMRLEASLDAAINELLEGAEMFRKLTGKEYTEIPKNFVVTDKLKKYLVQISEAKLSKAQFEAELIKAREIEGTYREAYNDLQDSIKELTEKKDKLNAAFFKKYSRFIQEGTWISEDYTDDERYYIDARATLNNSCFPKVSYTINITDVGALGGEYERYRLNLADKTWVEDVEFFGYSDFAKKIPFQEEVIVTEISRQLDEPNKNTIKVQNFTNQFADLFSKITATTQQVKYEGGAWDRAAAFVNYENEKKGAFLQDALNSANMTLMNAGDQSVVWDNTGITVTDLTFPSNQVKIVGGGLLLRNDKDDGTEWVSALTSKGLSANVITTGQLNTREIFIMNGDEPTFRWDALGITAYDYAKDADGTLIYGINPKTGIRFDKFGVYGYTGRDGSDYWAPNSINEIDEVANFSLTWDGLKVTGNEGVVARIGKVKDDTSNSIVGDIINISKGNEIVLSVDNNGNLQMTGVITASSGGKIGPWNIDDNGLVGKYRISTSSGEPKDVYSGFIFPLQTEGSKIIFAGGIDEFGADAPFYVNRDGSFKATKGSIGGCQIDENGRLQIPAVNITGQLTATQIDATNLKVDAVNITGQLTATQIDATNLKVDAVNITGQLTATQIDATNLKVDAVNIEGKITFDSLPDNIATTDDITDGPSDEYITEITNTTIKTTTVTAENLKVKAANISDTLTAQQIDATNLNVVDGTFSGTLSAAKGTFAGSLSLNNGAYFIETDGTMSLPGLTLTDGDFVIQKDSEAGRVVLENGGSILQLLKSQTNLKGYEVYISSTNGGIYFNDVLYTDSSVSDQRLKNSVALLSDKYETFFDKIEPTRYRYNNGTSNRYHTGFIAQQVVFALEESGLTTQEFAGVILDKPNTDKECWYLRRDEFVALNTWQIQKLKPRVSSLEERVTALEAENAELKQQLVLLLKS